MKSEATTGKAVQVAETFKRWDDAHRCLDAQRAQVGFLGGRVYLTADNQWAVQAFHQAEGLELGAWMPDGMRVVLLPNGLASQLGISL